MFRLAVFLSAIACASGLVARSALTMTTGSQVPYRIRLKRISNQNKGRMRLNVFRSNQHIYAQVIDDKEGTTLCAASTLDETVKEATGGKGNDVSAAGKVGALLAERAKGKGAGRHAGLAGRRTMGATIGLPPPHHPADQGS